MKYVALLSGGKDSCYNLLHCEKSGHELIAAASLRPVAGKDEIDSYMYQTVGQDAIEYVADALGVPLYRQVIAGTAVDVSSEYGARRREANNGLQGDETEDLFELLSRVKTEHPDVQGVSVGAILSNYQRVRVEHVCRRLGLTPLCYLWRRDQRELLSEMISAGLVAVIIKVAGIGLTTEDLGKSLAQMQPKLLKLNDLYGAHVCGEGGEYETLTLDSPMFKKKIILQEVDTVIHSDNDFATVAYLRVKSASLQEKSGSVDIDPSIPPVLEDDFKLIRDTVDRSVESTVSQDAQPPYEPGSAILFGAMSSRSVARWVAVSNIQAKTHLHSEPDHRSIEDKVHECFVGLQARLSEHALDISHCANINIYIADMSLFARVNAVYTTYFGSSPPARACVAVDLPAHAEIQMDCIAFSEDQTTERQALHVQGLSYWAPANIGPYSQAITIRDQRVFISGQIGLLPRSLELPSPQSLAVETALACQHVRRITEALKSNSGGGWQGYTQLALYWLKNLEDLQHVKPAVEDLDGHAPTLFLGVTALPKGALIEKQVVLHTGRFTITGEDDTTEVQSLEPAVTTGSMDTDSAAVHWTISSFPQSAAVCAVVCFRGEISDATNTALKDKLSGSFGNVLSSRIFYRPSAEYSYDAHELLGDMNSTVVPCHFVADASRDDWDGAVCIIGV